MSRKNYHKDPMASVHVLAANSEQPEANANRIMLALRVAFEKLKIGSEDDAQFDRLAAAINVGLIRAEGIDSQAEAVMLAGVQAMMSCACIHARHGRFGFTGPDLLAMNDALDLYESILRLSTPKRFGCGSGTHAGNGSMTGLTSVTRDALRCVLKFGDGIKAKDLAALRKIGEKCALRQLDRMADAGLLRRVEISPRRFAFVIADEQMARDLLDPPVVKVKRVYPCSFVFNLGAA